MSYNINSLDNYEKIESNEQIPAKGKVQIPDEFGYEFVRFGDARRESFKHKEVQEDIKILLKYYNEYGYGNVIPKLNNFEFRKVVAAFRARLDVYELIPCTKVFSKDELYYRCLSEGPRFTEFLKKSRNTTLRGLTSLTETIIEDEYFHPELYSGYDSFLNERDLIHWDDRDDIDDIKYAFMPCDINVDGFEEKLILFLKSLRISPEVFDLNIDQISELKNTKMYDPSTRFTALMREFWTHPINLEEPYLAKRSRVLTYPGATRDTGIGDPSTIAKVKAINKICREILERCRHSASAPAHLSNQRLFRVLEGNTYLHLDFKKYGLSFPRELQNIAIRKIGEMYGIDTSPLEINSFYIDIDGKIYETCRGLMLGWIDCLNEICVHAILFDITQNGIPIDWIAFNDDVEISYFTNERNSKEKSEMIREIVLSSFNIYEIIISISKTYASKASIFLEKYFRFEKYNLNMEKRSLACKSYAKSLTTKHIWRAKIYFAAAYSIWPSEEVASRVILTSPIEFEKDERNASLFCGGWYPGTALSLDRSLEEQGPIFRSLACELQKIHVPDVSIRPVQVSSPQKIQKAKVQILRKGISPEKGRLDFKMDETRQDINFEIDGILDTFRFRRLDNRGRDNNFVSAYNRILERIESRIRIFDPG